MKPLHSSFARVHRCPCCHSKYGKEKGNAGKSAARQLVKLSIKKEES